MTTRPILAVTDFSSHGDNALTRAALLCAEHGIALELACIGCPDSPPADALSRLAQHAQQLSRAHGIVARGAGRLYDSLEALRPRVDAAELVVWGMAPVSGLRAFFMGQPVTELIRSAGRPVLVVRREARHLYQSVMVAVDFSERSRSLVDAGFWLSKSAAVELFHAVSTANEGKLRFAEVSESAINLYRQECRRYAQNRMIRFTDTFDTRRNRLQSTIAHGEPARQILVQQSHSGSDLIVVGKHPASTLSELVFGSVAGRLLNYSGAGDGSADVLVVPHGWQPAAAVPGAGRRNTWAGSGLRAFP